MRRRLPFWIAVCGAVIVLPVPLRAQASPPGRVEVAAGARWVGRTSAGGADATETAADGTRFRLFATDSSLGSAAAVEGRVGVRVTRLLQLEGSASYGRPQLRVRISSDVEGIPDVAAIEAVKQFTIEGALVAHLVRWSIGTRAVPFVSGGVGYLRQLHEGDQLVATGGAYHAGGGVDFLVKRRDAGRLKSAGWRADVRAIIRNMGVAFDDAAHVAVGVGASVFLRF